MNKQQINLTPSGVAQAEALAELTVYLEREFNLSFDEARWMSAGIIHNLTCAIKANPESHRGLSEIAGEIKNQKHSLNN
ncbi:hypothetical protein [Calothrix sp. PCC 6303]|uniref:hypothetical protein n=1 Tax=Calothrix sp. PCC 6303 TaxID=1170562 RepID=UPI0002A03532|nr:hypothetical protein [Calothrix sp. PCC 6303]AFZ01620.1 hypothetical protein Cal6303_2647 [Calothrix sp. PCC 6303]